jgi:hypothetical protein
MRATCPAHLILIISLRWFKFIIMIVICRRCKGHQHKYFSPTVQILVRFPVGVNSVAETGNGEQNARLGGANASLQPVSLITGHRGLFHFIRYSLDKGSAHHRTALARGRRKIGPLFSQETRHEHTGGEWRYSSTHW